MDMHLTPRRFAGLFLAGLLAITACEDSSCGGCVTPLAEPFPEAPRVYDGVQVRISQSGLAFVEQNLPQILDNLLEDGLQFEIPTSTTSLLGTDIELCAEPCPVTAAILQARITLLQPDRVAVDANIDLDTVVTVDSVLGHCEFPVALRDKPVAAEVQLFVDPASYFLHFDVGGVEVTIADEDYQIECPWYYDFLLEALKSYITGILNSQVQGQLDDALADLVAEQTCLPCDFYSGGCPAGSSCDDGFCAAGGDCLIKPLGLAGTVDLGAQLADVDPSNDADLDLLIAAGQAQQPNQRPFVRANGLEVRALGGTFSQPDGCLPEPDPAQMPPTGIADPMQFGNLIPGQGQSYMAAVSVADMYLDHFVYQLWRSGFFCLTIDSYGLDLISASTLELILPSIGRLTAGANVPVRLGLEPESVPYVEIGAGTFLPDGTVDEPILYVFLPDLRLDIWAQLDGRWTRLLALVQDMRLDLALEFTPDNQVVPIVDEDSIAVDDVRLVHYELLAESEQQLRELVPSLIGIALPQLLGSLEEIAIPPLQGFVLDIKAVQGDMPRAGGSYHDFMSIYADLDFEQPPPVPPVETAVRLERRATGWALVGLPADQELQLRVDGGLWRPFRRGPAVALPADLLPGAHRIEVRARRRGAYRSLDPSPQSLELVLQRPAGPTPAVAPPAPVTAEHGAAVQPTERSAPDGADQRVGCASAAAGGRCCGLLLVLGLALLIRRRGVRNPDTPRT
jgi:hypothetical protein